MPSVGSIARRIRPKQEREQRLAESATASSISGSDRRPLLWQSALRGNQGQSARSPGGVMSQARSRRIMRQGPRSSPNVRCVLWTASTLILTCV